MMNENDSRPLPQGQGSHYSSSRCRSHGFCSAFIIPHSAFVTMIAGIGALALALSSFAADLTIGLGADVTSMDPHVLNAAPNNSIGEQVFDTLVRRDPRQRFVPGLAESWRTVDDTTWEFKLRRGVKFHNGADFTAE